MSTFSGENLRPDPYEGEADVNGDPEVPQGKFPFENHEHPSVTQLDVAPDAESDGADFD